jgi:hypothetical protein
MKDRDREKAAFFGKVEALTSAPSIARERELVESLGLLFWREAMRFRRDNPDITESALLEPSKRTT